MLPSAASLLAVVDVDFDATLAAPSSTSLLAVVVKGADFRVQRCWRRVYREEMRHGGLWTLDSAVSDQPCSCRLFLASTFVCPVCRGCVSFLAHRSCQGGWRYCVDTVVQVPPLTVSPHCPEGAFVPTLLPLSRHATLRALLQSTFVGSSIVGCVSLLGRCGCDAAGGQFVVGATVADKCTADTTKRLVSLMVLLLSRRL